MPQASSYNQELHQDCQKAVEMIRKMTGAPKEMIPREYLKRCKGLHFVITKTGGFVASVSTSKSFTIRRLGKLPNGKPRWSGPLFSSSSQVGLGLTAGYQDVETIIVLGDETAVDKFRSSHLGTAVDIDMIAGRNSSVIQKDEQLHALSTCVPFSIAGGACLDFSFKGGRVSIDKKKNQLVYGSRVKPADILDGRFEAPEEFESLYTVLNAVSSSKASA